MDIDFNKDYYKILDVPKDSSDDTIKKAYRKLANKYHPDKNKGDATCEAKFKDINAAYQVLNDKSKKEQYDVQSPNGKNYNPNFNNPFGNMFGNMNNNGFPFDIFNMFNMNQKQYFENLDIDLNLKVKFSDIYNNTPLTITYNRMVYCDKCNGTGNINGAVCDKCKGQKLVSKKETFNINNTYQISDRFNLRKTGFGNYSKLSKNMAGNLNVNIIYENDTNFITSSRGLEYKLNLHYQDAIDGIKFKLKLPDNKDYNINIPAKTKDGDVLRVQNMGVLTFDGKTRTDLFVTINIIINYEKIK